VIAAVTLAVAGTLLCLGLVRLITKLKVTVKSELTGLDMDIHGESAD
jgi:Amt family ammonium transporter